MGQRFQAVTRDQPLLRTARWTDRSITTSERNQHEVVATVTPFLEGLGGREPRSRCRIRARGTLWQDVGAEDCAGRAAGVADDVPLLDRVPVTEPCLAGENLPNCALRVYTFLWLILCLIKKEKLKKKKKRSQANINSPWRKVKAWASNRFCTFTSRIASA